MIQYGLKRANADPCIYYSCQKSIIAGIYVDDLLNLGKLQQINDFKDGFKNTFVDKNLGAANYILSMKITKVADVSVSFDQTLHTAEVLEVFKMTYAKCAVIPLDANLNYSRSEDAHP